MSKEMNSVRDYLIHRIRHGYLAIGGLFNPELAMHDKVSKLLQDVLEYLDTNRAEPVRKVQLPERHWHHDVGHFYDSEEVIDALKAANVEIEP